VNRVAVLSRDAVSRRWEVNDTGTKMRDGHLEKTDLESSQHLDSREVRYQLRTRYYNKSQGSDGWMDGGVSHTR